jgi:hypothetical protein
MIDKLNELDRKIPVHAKISPAITDLKSLVRDRSPDMLRQTRKAVEAAIASLEAALHAEKSAANSRFIAEAAKGQLQPRPPIRIVHED